MSAQVVGRDRIAAEGRLRWSGCVRREVRSSGHVAVQRFIHGHIENRGYDPRTSASIKQLVMYVRDECACVFAGLRVVLPILDGAIGPEHWRFLAGRWI